MLSLRGITWEYGCERGARGRSATGLSPRSPSSQSRGGTHHTEGQLLVQGVVGQVVHRHGQGRAGGRGGVGEAPQGVLIPPEIHVIVEALQGLGEVGGGALAVSEEGCPLAPAPPTIRSIGPVARTHHAWVLCLQGHKLPKRRHVSGLGVRGRRRGVQDVVVTGDEVGVGLVGHRELLHGARLDQLLRKGAEAGERSSGLWVGS